MGSNTSTLLFLTSRQYCSVVSSMSHDMQSEEDRGEDSSSDSEDVQLAIFNSFDAQSTNDNR